MSTDSLTYLTVILGHFLNSTEYQLARLEKDYNVLSEEWLAWNTTYITSTPIELTECDYNELRAIFYAMGRKLKGFETTLKTTFPLLLKIDITDAVVSKPLIVKSAMLKRAMVDSSTNDNGWHVGLVLRNNVEGLLKLLKLHLNELRQVYTDFQNGGYSDYTLMVSINKKFSLHYQAMKELISNFLFTLKGKVEEVIATFEGQTL